MFRFLPVKTFSRRWPGSKLLKCPKLEAHRAAGNTLRNGVEVFSTEYLVQCLVADSAADMVGVVIVGQLLLNQHQSTGTQEAYLHSWLILFCRSSK